MKNLKWLHLSDIHMPSEKSDSYRLDSVIEALFRTLEEEAKRDEFPDIIFFTGDIAYDGKDYTKANIFFSKLLEVTKLNERFGDQARRYLYIIPGNHDVDRTQTKFLSRPITNRDDSNIFFSPDEKEQRRIFFRRFEHFQTFFNTFFSGIRTIDSDRPFYTDELSLPNKNVRIAVVGLNSAIFSQDDKDEHNLWIGERICVEAFKALEPDNFDLIFALHHHPYSWLHNEESRHMKGLLTNKADICLFGHMHELQTEEIHDQNGRVLRFQSGALYDKSPYPYRILYGSLNNDKIIIQPKTYQEGPPSYWTLDTSLFPHKAPDHTESFDLPRKKPENKEKNKTKANNSITSQNENITQNISNDIQLSNVEWSDRDNKLIEAYFKLCAVHDDLYSSSETWDERKLKDHFINNGLAGNDESGHTFLTHAGLLLFGRRDSIPQYIYNVEVILIDSNELRHSFSGPVDLLP